MNGTLDLSQLTRAACCLHYCTALLLCCITILQQAVDEVSNQMEEPFKMIPIDDILGSYYRDINR